MSGSSNLHLSSFCIFSESVEESKNEPQQPNGTAHNSQNFYPDSNNSGDASAQPSQAINIAVVSEPNRTTMTTRADMTPPPHNNNMGKARDDTDNE